MDMEEEVFYETIKCELTQKQAEFLKKYIRSMRITEIPIIDHKNDFIITEEYEELVEEIEDAFHSRAYNWGDSEFACGVYGIDYDLDCLEVFYNDVIIEDNDKFLAEISVSMLVIWPWGKDYDF